MPTPKPRPTPQAEPIPNGATPIAVVWTYTDGVQRTNPFGDLYPFYSEHFLPAPTDAVRYRAAERSARLSAIARAEGR